MLSKQLNQSLGSLADRPLNNEFKDRTGIITPTLSRFELLPDDILFTLLPESPNLRYVSKSLHAVAERYDHHVLLNYVRMGACTRPQNPADAPSSSPDSPKTQFDEQILLETILNDPVITSFLAEHSYKTDMDKEYIRNLEKHILQKQSHGSANVVSSNPHDLTTRNTSNIISSTPGPFGTQSSKDKGKSFIHDPSQMARKTHVSTDTNQRYQPNKWIVSDRALLAFLQRDFCFFEKKHIITPKPDTEIQIVTGDSRINSVENLKVTNDNNIVNTQELHPPNSSFINPFADTEEEDADKDADLNSYHWQYITDPRVTPGSGTCVYAKNVHWLWLQYRTRLAPGYRYKVYLNLRTENAFSLTSIRFMLQESPYVKQTFQPYVPVYATAGQHQVLNNPESKGGNIYMGDIEILVPPPPEIVEVKGMDNVADAEFEALESQQLASDQLHDIEDDEMDFGLDEEGYMPDSDSSDTDNDDSDFFYYHDETGSYVSTSGFPSGSVSPNLQRSASYVNTADIRSPTGSASTRAPIQIPKSHDSHGSQLQYQHALPSVGTSYSANSYLSTTPFSSSISATSPGSHAAVSNLTTSPSRTRLASLQAPSRPRSRIGSFTNIANLSASTHTNISSSHEENHVRKSAVGAGGAAIRSGPTPPVACRDTVPHLQLHRQLQQVEKERELEEQLHELDEGDEKKKVHRRLLLQKHGKGGSATSPAGSTSAAVSAVVSAVESRVHTRQQSRGPSRASSRGASGTSTPGRYPHNNNNQHSLNDEKRSSLSASPLHGNMIRHAAGIASRISRHRDSYSDNGDAGPLSQSHPRSSLSISHFPGESSSSQQSISGKGQHRRQHRRPSKTRRESKTSAHPVLKEMRRAHRRERILEELAAKAKPPSKWPTIVFEIEDTGIGINRGIQFNYLYFVPVGCSEPQAQGHEVVANQKPAIKQWTVLSKDTTPEFVQTHRITTEFRQAYDRYTELKNATAVLRTGLESGTTAEALEGIMEGIVSGTGAGSASDNSAGSGED